MFCQITQHENLTIKRPEKKTLTCFTHLYSTRKSLEHPNAHSKCYVKLNSHARTQVHEAKASSTFWSDTMTSVEPSLVSSVYQGGVLPPTSASSFLQVSTDVAVLSGYNASFGNRTKYQSQFDLTSLLSIERITRAATVLAKGALKAAGLSDVSSVTANTTLVENLVNCFGVNPGCDLFERYTGLSGDALVSYYKKDDEHVSVRNSSARISSFVLTHFNNTLLRCEKYSDTNSNLLTHSQ